MLSSGGSLETPTHITSCSGDIGTPLYRSHLPAVWRSSAFRVATGDAQRNRADVSELFSFFIPLGVFLLLAARNPSAHRSLIAFTAWWSLAHSSVMVIETVQAWKHGVRRDFTDVIITAVIGCALLLLMPARRSSPAVDA